MIPTIAANGTSFKGAARYYLSDKDADTRERVEWTHTENLVTNDPDRAWKVMAWTASQQAGIKECAGLKGTGRKLEKPVFAFSLSWHPEQRPDKGHMLASAKAAVAALGLAEHQAIYISHNDEPQPHVHVLVNRVHPTMGKAATLSKSRKTLSAWALAYEKQHGKIYCEAREDKEERQAEPKARRPRNPVIQAAWERSDSGRSFQAALAAEKYTLAWGNRRIVVVDRWGKAINPVRHLERVRASAFHARLQDIDRKSLPLATTVQREIKIQERKKYHASRKYDRWTAHYLNQVQDRHIGERAKLQITYEMRREQKAAALAAYYQTQERAKAIEELQHRIDKGGFFRRITGGVKRDKAELLALELQAKDIERRTNEQVGAVDAEKERAVADQTDRHAHEKELALKHVAEKKPAFYKEESITKEKSAAQEKDRGEGREREPGHDLG